MDERRLTREELAAAIRAESDVSEWQIERWHKADLIPRPVRKSLGHGRGYQSTYPPGTLEWLRTLIRFRQVTDDTRTLHMLLWLAGYPIPLARVRESMVAVFERTWGKMLAEVLPGQFEDEGEYADSLVQEHFPKVNRETRKVLRQRLPRGEDQVAALTALLTLSLGGEWYGGEASYPTEGNESPLHVLCGKFMGLQPLTPSDDDLMTMFTGDFFNMRLLYAALVNAADKDLLDMRHFAAGMIGMIALIQSGKGINDPSALNSEAYARVLKMAVPLVTTAIAGALRAREAGYAENVRMLVDAANKGGIAPHTDVVE